MSINPKQFDNIMKKLPSTLSISVLSVKCGKEDSDLRCNLELAGQSVTLGVPSQAITIEKVRLEEDDILLVSAFADASEIGKCKIKLLSHMKSDRCIDSEFNLSKAPDDNQELLQSVSTSGKIHIRVEPFDIAGSIQEMAMAKVEIQLGQLREMLQESYDSRTDLHARIEESTQKFIDHHASQSSLQRSTAKMLADTQTSLIAQQTANDQLLQDNRNHETKIEEFNLKIESLNSQVKQYYEHIQVNETCRKLLQESWEERDSIRSSYSQSTAEYESNAKEQDGYLTTMQAENSAQRRRILELEEELAKIKNENDSLHTSVLRLTTELSALKGKYRVLQEQKEREKELERLLNETERANKELKVALETLREASQLEFEKLKLMNEKILNENAQVKGLLEESRTLHANSKNECNELMSQIHDLKASVLKFEEDKTVKEDLTKIIEQINLQNQQLQDHQTQLLNDVETLSNTVKNHEDTIEAAYKKIDGLNGTIQEHEQTIETAHKDIEDLKSENQSKGEEISRLTTLLNARKIYFPDKEDPVDIAMADYVNTVSPPIPVSISKEEQGVYMFGTKRVFVKLEIGKLIFRVGGGFMQIEDFVEVYSPGEIEKYENKMRDQAQTVRKSIYGKYAKGMITDKESVPPPETPPLGSNYTTYYAIKKKSEHPARASLSPKKKKKRVLKSKGNNNRSVINESFN